MTPRQLKEGRKVKIQEQYRATVMRSCGHPGPLRGAGGHLIPDSLVFYQTGTIAHIGPKRDRVIMVWDTLETGIWIDIDMIDPD